MVMPPVDDSWGDMLEVTDAVEGADVDGQLLTDDDADEKLDADCVDTTDIDTLPLLQIVTNEVAVAIDETVAEKLADIVSDAVAHDEGENEGDEDANDDGLDEVDEALVTLGLLDEDAAGDGDALDDGNAVALGDVELLFVAPVETLG